MSALVNIHRIDWNNLGDQASTPVRYFKELRKAQVIDVNAPSLPPASHYLVGGGGLLHPAWFGRLQDIVYSGRPVILWGIGMNQHDTDRLLWPKMFDQVPLAGLRDWGNPWHYVPCASCLHGAFDTLKKMRPRHRYVIYEHHALPLPLTVEAPRLQNRQPFKYFADVLRFLASGEVVVTNCYHGLFWGMLLNRRVLCFRPYSNRFYSFKTKPLYADVDDWTAKLDLAASAGDNYLDESRALNLKFWERVKELL